MHTGFEALAQFRLQQQTLRRVIGRRNGHVRGVGQNVEIGDADAETEIVGNAHLREQEARFALHCIVRNREERQIGDRMAEKLQTGLFQPDRMGLAVLNDAFRLDLPQRRLFGPLGAGQTRGVDAVVEDH
ncbi:hypothetical protein D3C86_1296740 [compost metagenome]